MGLFGVRDLGPVRIVKHPNGRRMYVRTHWGWARVHHGLVFALLAVAFAFGAWTDWHDFPWTSDSE